MTPSEMAERARALVTKRLEQYDEISRFLYEYDPAFEDADAGPEFIAGAEMVMERIRAIITPPE